MPNSHVPRGLRRRLLSGGEFIGNEPVALVLGDNIFYGQGFSAMLHKAAADARNGRATIFGYHVSDPTRYGVVDLDAEGNPVHIEEKPQSPPQRPCRGRLVLLSVRFGRRCRCRKAFGTRGARDNLGQRTLPQYKATQCTSVRTRLRMARYRHCRFTHGGIGFCRGNSKGRAC